MRKRVGLLAVAGLLLVPGTAAAGDPQIVDIAGDANGLNLGEDTRPASYDPADLLEVRLETSYVAIPIGDDGIHYEPTALVLRYRTLAAPRSDASTLAFELHATIDGCPSRFEGFLAGPLTNPGDGRGGTVEWHWGEGCPGLDPTGIPFVGVGATHTGADWTAEPDPTSSELVVTVPFGSLDDQAAEVLRVGALVSSPSAAVRPSNGASLVGTFSTWVHNTPIDQTETGLDFTVGEDVPPDVPCTSGCP